MKLDTVRPGAADIAGSLSHHLLCLPRQAQDLVDHYLGPDLMQLLHRPVIDLQVIAPAQICRGGGMDGLEPQLHPHFLFRRALRQQLQHRRR